MTTTATGRRSGWRARSLLVAGPELAAIGLLGSAVTLWGVPSRGASAVDAAPFALALAYFSILAGRLVVGALRLPADRFGVGEIPTVFLVGFLTLNTLLTALALALPLSLPADAALIAAGVAAWAGRADPPARRVRGSATGLGCLALSLAAATLWSIDSIAPTVTSHGEVVFRPWADSFPNSCFVRIFRDTRGASSLGHFSLAGEPAPIYHYAGFVVPALLAATSGASCYLAYSTFMIPLGLALTGLAASLLGRWWYGPGAGLAASVGVLLIPDASRYGIANPFLSYFWLAETGPTMTYGVALIAVAWALVFEGCRAGRLGLVAAGFAAAGLSVAFKAHLFVANALLIWAYPAFFLRGYSRRARLAWLAFAVATFGAAARASGRFDGVPLLRLDGSGLKPYLTAVAANLNDPGIRRLLAVGPGTSPAHDLAAGLAHLTFGTLGAFAAAFPILGVILVAKGGPDRRARVETALFPALVTANYLVMALGLAPDDRTRHTPDELLHRPLVWAYFAVAAWASGGFYALALRPRLARPGPARAVVAAGVAALLAVPAYFGQGVQVGPGWGKEVTSIRLPVGFVRSAGFLRDHSARGDVVQGSRDDRWNVLGCLAERPVYVADTWRLEEQADARIVRRLGEMASFRRLSDPAEILAFAARRRIAWFVLDPEVPVRWPASILDRPAFEAGGFRVYRLAPPG